MSQDKNKQTPEESFELLKQNVKTIHLSTITKEGKPSASYSPFVCDEIGNFYIFVSGLASHTQDLLAHPEVGILLVEDEDIARQIYARQRISYQCNVEIVDIENKDYSVMLGALEKRFGNIIELLKTLPDFILFRIIPYQGQYVKGFGKAYKLIGANLQEFEHIKPNEK